jgi:hypothetical protein
MGVGQEWRHQMVASSAVAKATHATPVTPIVAYSTVHTGPNSPGGDATKVAQGHASTSSAVTQ